MLKINSIPSFKDNYIWLIGSDQNLIVIDPGEAKPVIDYIIKHKLVLNSIWLTHNHADHVGGVAELREFAKVDVYGVGRDSNILVQDQKTYVVDTAIQILALSTPGHTEDGYSYLVNHTHLFCGDTLFGAGCGRVFTSDYRAMYNSLCKIKSLPKDTLIYPAHEYTLSNLEFAKALETKNSGVLMRYDQVKNQRSKNLSTLPTQLELELKTNPFLRCGEEIFATYGDTELERFTTLRKLKDGF